MEEILSALSERLPMVEVGCPACRATTYRSSFTRSGFRIVTCDFCGTLYVTPRPTEDALLEVYHLHPELADFGGDLRAMIGQDGRAEAQYRLRSLLEVRDSGRLLDVGYGRGEFLREAQSRFETHGVDVSPRDASALPDARLFAGRLEDARFSSSSYDVVSLVEVLEHLFEPRRTLREIHRILKPGGVLVLQTGDAGSVRARLSPTTWDYVRPPIHLNCFSRAGLRRLVHEVGFQVRIARSFGRAPERFPGIHRLPNPELLRPIVDLAARAGLIGQLYILAKAEPDLR